MIYLDASTLVTLIAGRTYRLDLTEFLSARPDMPTGTSTIGFVETARVLDRTGNVPDVMRQLVNNFSEILVTEEIRDAAAALPGSLRTLDAIHIASAQVIGSALDTLVTYDKRMLSTARAAGLPGTAPGLDG